MEKILKTLLSVTVAFNVFIYLVFSLTQASFNLSDWGQSYRDHCAWIMIGGSFIINIFIPLTSYLEGDKK